MNTFFTFHSVPERRDLIRVYVYRALLNQPDEPNWRVFCTIDLSLN